MLDFELLYVTIGGKERISTATMPGIFWCLRVEKES